MLEYKKKISYGKDGSDDEVFISDIVCSVFTK